LSANSRDFLFVLLNFGTPFPLRLQLGQLFLGFLCCCQGDCKLPTLLIELVQSFVDGIPCIGILIDLPF